MKVAIQLQRHAPCVCGSRRPLVECCLPWEEAFRSLVARLAAFVEADRVRRLATRAAELFWTAPAPAGSEASVACFHEWFLQDYVAPKNTGTLLGEFADASAGLRAHEEQLLFGLLLTPARAFQFMDSPGPRGVLVKDLLMGSEAVVGIFALPDGLIRSDVCVGRLLPFGRFRRVGLSLLRFPADSQGELMAYLRAAYGVSRPGRHVSFEDFVDGAAHLYHHFFLERGLELGGRAHRTCRWVRHAVGQVPYRAVEASRVRAALARQPALERLADEDGHRRYLWVDRVHAVALGSVVVGPERVQARAETIEDLQSLSEFLEGCLRGLIERLPADTVVSGTPASRTTARQRSAPAGTAFIHRMLDGWPDAAWALPSGQMPRDACGSKFGRDEVVQALVALERDMARQKRLGRAWGEVGPLWDALNLSHLLPTRTAAEGGEVRERSVAPRGKRSFDRH